MILRLIVLFVAILLEVAPAQAHESRPGYLQLSVGDDDSVLHGEDKVSIISI